TAVGGGGDGQRTREPRVIREPQSRDLDRIGQGHVLDELEGNAMRVVREAAVALSVPTLVRPRVLADREQSWSPQLAAVLVADVDHLAGLVADRIVRPRRELVLAAVERPRVTGAGFRHLESDLLVRDHIHPRGGGPAPLVEYDAVPAAAPPEAPQVVVEFPPRPRDRRLGGRLAVGHGPTLATRGRRRVLGATDLLGQRAQAA